MPAQDEDNDWDLQFRTLEALDMSGIPADQAPSNNRHVRRRPGAAVEVTKTFAKKVVTPTHTTVCSPRPELVWLHPSCP